MSTLKKSPTFLLQKSPSMEIPIRKPLSIEFPTSPQPTMGEEILHFSHPHPLPLFTLSDRFTCAGCKEDGAGKRFSCQQCDFQLHEFCASSPPALNGHPLHAQHQLVFYSKPKPGGMLRPRCDICGKPASGFAFRCGACTFQMHPCCAMLSTEMSFSIHRHLLKLLPTMTGSSNDPGFACGECKRKRSGRVYRCTVCDYHLHAVCAKDMINGLQANGIKGQEKSSMLGVATRLASNAVKGFLAKLIEGIGEGVGESVAGAIAQDITRGQGNSKRRM
ncbi:hypothetical protein F0562_036208 [Nyssa sinensis]|uniref:DC1 domain-containing protein n=1 Tax=Nyssa sinensis TaxID=561372 RepID=A0A5J5AD22_9ASTE|nr:hypothetical protein F0562_036208 [Nyssa sinensis]